MQDFDKTIEAVETILDITQEVQKDLEDGKLSIAEGATLVVKHGVQAVKTIANLKEIGAELLDLESDEAAEVTGIVVEHFGGSDEAKEALEAIAAGAATMYRGISKLIEIRNEG
jgi:hypothetical protein